MTPKERAVIKAAVEWATGPEKACTGRGCKCRECLLLVAVDEYLTRRKR